MENLLNIFLEMILFTALKSIFRINNFRSWFSAYNSDKNKLEISPFITIE